MMALALANTLGLLKGGGGGGIGGIAKGMASSSLGAGALRVAGPVAIAYAALHSDDLGPPKGSAARALEDGQKLTRAQEDELAMGDPAMRDSLRKKRDGQDFAKMMMKNKPEGPISSMPDNSVMNPLDSVLGINKKMSMPKDGSEMMSKEKSAKFDTDVAEEVSRSDATTSLVQKLDEVKQAIIGKKGGPSVRSSAGMSTSMRIR
jgi:hypothetical protein